MPSSAGQGRLEGRVAGEENVLRHDHAAVEGSGVSSTGSLTTGQGNTTYAQSEAQHSQLA